MNHEIDWLDEDGYPTEAALEHIKAWPWDHPEGWRGLFDFVKSLWYFRAWGWQEKPGETSIGKPVQKLYVSTAGWSGNEDIIRALENNWMFWSACWEQSRRGGHYIFELPSRSDA